MRTFPCCAQLLTLPMLALLVSAGLLLRAGSASAAEPKAVFDSTCSACHASGVAGAPKIADTAEWNKRLARAGLAGLVESALKGRGAMPPKGGNSTLSDDDVKATVAFMARTAGAAVKADGAAAAPAQVARAPVAPRVADKVDATTSAGRATYQTACSVCHKDGVLNAPKLGDVAAWSPRIGTGKPALYASALGGKNAMPAKGGNPTLSDDEVKAAVDFLVAQAQKPARAAEPKTAAVTVAKPTTRPATAESAPAAAPPVPPAGASAAPAATAPAAVAAAPAPSPTATAAAEVNAFNRLLRAPAKRNLPPPQDGIHDPTNDGTLQLQAPLDAYAGWPKSNAGNQIDWVKALGEQRIKPRADRVDPKTEMAVLDLNIVREVKGSMPDVVYPHRQHTQWLDCSNCHPAIFVPQKGANQISMASILLGQKCGVCHGKVAFPVSECRLCHSKPKAAATASTGAKP